MRRGQDHIEGGRLVVGEVQLPAASMFASMPCNSLNRAAMRGVDVVDGSPLFGGFGHRHPAGDLQSV